ncbi:hypothetical protein IMZ48_10295 [Candidatus Bathyarchaeota archaeon]|nr:hypothetical protein [Candidatus Bathyarchaeota archaeon]
MLLDVTFRDDVSSRACVEINGEGDPTRLALDLGLREALARNAERLPKELDLGNITVVVSGGLQPWNRDWRRRVD